MRIRFLSFFTIVSLLFALGFSACKKQVADISPEVLSNYLSGFTAGVISKKQAVRVQFATNIASAAQVGQTEPRALLKFSPSMNGTAVWESPRTLAFTPSETWTAGEVYTATVDLASAIDTLKNGPKSYSFQFSVQESSLRVVLDGLYTPEPSRLSEQAIGGQVQANDYLEEGSLEGLIVAEQAGRKLAVVYQRSGEMTFNFVVTGVERGQEPSEVQLSWDAQGIKMGVAKSSTTVEVPALGEFKVLQVHYENEENPHIAIRFSDPLDERQDLNGLLSLLGASLSQYSIKSNLIKVFVQSGLSGAKQLTIHSGIKNSVGAALGRDVVWELNFTRPDPALRLVGEGVIMPYQGPRLYPFEAIGLTAVKVEIFKIFDNNIQQYLQENQLEYGDDYYSLQRVGRIVSQDRVLLSALSSENDLDNWTRYTLDLSKFFVADPKAIYQVRIGFGMEDIRRVCDQKLADFGIQEVKFGQQKQDINIGFVEEPNSIFGDYYGIYGYYDGQNWEDRDEPCKPAYYNSQRFLSKPLISSNLGMIVKQDGQRRTVVLTTDLITGKAASSAQVKLYDAQRQVIFSGSTDASGFVEAITDQRPDFAIASRGNDVAYLKVDYATALSMSKFNVGGVAAEDGLKGQIYGERGVWRPGDSIFLNFVLEDRYNKLPPAYPLAFSVFDAKGRLREERIVTPAAGDMYALHFATQPDDPTGSWRASVSVGGKTFTKNIKVETVKPNRLRIDLDFNKQVLSPTNTEVKLRSIWLHGAPARNLKVDVALEIVSVATGFADWPGYVFRDPSRFSGTAYDNKIFEGSLDEEGRSSFRLPDMGRALPGRMKAIFKTRVFEPGGNFSVDNISTEYMPFNQFVGLSLPKSRWGGNMLELEKENKLSVVTVDQDGKVLAGRKLSVGVYQVQWRYWWESGSDNISRYSSSDHKEADQRFEVTTGSDGKLSLPVKVSKWGRYLVKVCDTASGHCTGDYAYAGSPSAGEMDREAASILRLQADKEQYNVGDKVSINIPASQDATILLSLENSAGVLQSEWIQAVAGDNTYTFTADERMLPNVYAQVMLIQPHANTTNDRPLRMYGVIPILIEDPATRLQPLIATADEYQPEQEVSLTLSEKNGKAMSYTIAIVDEGLLSLTRFATPDLWKGFFAKEALSVRTFDLFNQVVGATNGSPSRVLAIGGDEDLGATPANPRANRFEPVVRHIGPFQLAAGKKATHKVKLPNYIGAVKVMAVVAGNHAYGKAEKIVPVRKPLMILPTLPRVLGPGEEVKMPVNVFAMTNKVKNAKVTVRESTGKVSFLNSSNSREASQQQSFSQPGDATLYFPIKVGTETGIAKFDVIAEGNGERVTQSIEIDVRNPNTFQNNTELLSLQAGESKTVSYQPFGMPSTRIATLEVASLPSLNLMQHMQYIFRYPYGCAEQTVSKAFPLLYVDKLIKLSTEIEEDRRKIILGSINHLVRFLNPNSSLSTWPGGNRANPWTTSYATHFLLEAEAAGYQLPLKIKEQLLSFQKAAAADWKTYVFDYYVNDQQRHTDQAYRLYTLALAQQPDLGAMNRLRSSAKLPATAAYRLAGAYALVGQQNVAKELISKVSTLPLTPYREYSYTYGSQLRDMAMVLEMQMLLGETDKAGDMALRLANIVNKRRWLSTQEIGFILHAMSKVVGSKGTSDEVLVRFNLAGGRSQELGSSSAILQIELPTQSSGSFQLTNLGNVPIFASLITRGQPLPGEEKAIESNLKMNIRYTDMKGQAIDVSKLASGTDFYAIYSITNPGTLASHYREMALKSAVASGWEIVNQRMDLLQNNRNESYYAYRDYQDAHVATFFDLNNGANNEYYLQLTAAYPGRYYLPTQVAEAMYDDDVQAATLGRWVEVTD